MRDSIYVIPQLSLWEFPKLFPLGAHPKDANWITFSLTCQNSSPGLMSLFTVCLILRDRNAISSSGRRFWTPAAQTSLKHSFTPAPDTAFVCRCRCFLAILLCPIVLPRWRWKGIATCHSVTSWPESHLLPCAQNQPEASADKTTQSQMTKGTDSK